MRALLRRENIRSHGLADELRKHCLSIWHNRLEFCCHWTPRWMTRKSKQDNHTAPFSPQPPSDHHHLLSHLPLRLLICALRLTLHLARSALRLSLQLLSFARRLSSDLAGFTLRFGRAESSGLLGFLCELLSFVEAFDGGAGEGLVGLLAALDGMSVWGLMGMEDVKVATYLFGGVGGGFAEGRCRGKEAGVAGESCAEHCGGCCWVYCIDLAMELFLGSVGLMIDCFCFVRSALAGN